MSTNRVPPLLILVFVLIVLPLLAGCEGANFQTVALAAPESGEIDNQAVDEAFVGRWQALARFYSTNPFAGASLTGLQADDVTTYRWLAMAHFFAENPQAVLDLRLLSPDESAAFRWKAMADAYLRLGLIHPE